MQTTWTYCTKNTLDKFSVAFLNKFVCMYMYRQWMYMYMYLVYTDIICTCLIFVVIHYCDFFFPFGINHILLKSVYIFMSQWLHLKPAPCYLNSSFPDKKLHRCLQGSAYSIVFDLLIMQHHSLVAIIILLTCIQILQRKLNQLER